MYHELIHGTILLIDENGVICEINIPQKTSIINNEFGKVICVIRQNLVHIEDEVEVQHYVDDINLEEEEKKEDKVEVQHYADDRNIEEKKEEDEKEEEEEEEEEKEPSYKRQRFNYEEEKEEKTDSSDIDSDVVILVKHEVVDDKIIHMEDNIINIRLPDIEADYIPVGCTDRFIGVLFETIPEIKNECFVCGSTAHDKIRLCPLRSQMYKYAIACADAISVIRTSVEKSIYKLKS